MGKKRLSKGYVSKGERASVSKKIKNMKITTPVDRALNQQRAFNRGITDPWVTIENPVKKTNQQYIKVRYSVLNNVKPPKRSLVG